MERRAFRENGPIGPAAPATARRSHKEKVMPKFFNPRRATRLFATTAALALGFVAVEVTAAYADPPSHAKAHGWNKKQKKSKIKHQKSCREDDRYSDRNRYRYESDYRRQEQSRRYEDQRRWEEEQRRRQRYEEDDRYYDDRGSRGSGVGLEDLAGVFLGGGRGDLGGLLGGGGLGDLLGGGRGGLGDLLPLKNIRKPAARR